MGDDGAGSTQRVARMKIRGDNSLYMTAKTGRFGDYKMVFEERDQEIRNIKFVSEDWFNRNYLKQDEGWGPEPGYVVEFGEHHFWFGIGGSGHPKAVAVLR